MIDEKLTWKKAKDMDTEIKKGLLSKEEEDKLLDSSLLFREVSDAYLNLRAQHTQLLSALNDKKFLKNQLRIVNNKR